VIIDPKHPLGFALWVMSVLVLVYLLAPLAIFVASTFGETGYLAFPPQGFTLKWYIAALDNPRYFTGFLVSLRLATIVAVLSLLIGGTAAFAIVRFRFPGAALITSILLSPLALPGLVLAVALTIFFSRTLGLVGTERLILAHLIICVPTVLRILIPVLERFDVSLEEAAMNLGATPLQALVLVTFPILRPGIIAAFGFAFILSFDEVEMALFLASPRETPLTAVLYAAAQLAFDPTIAAVSALLIAIVFVFMVGYQVASGLGRSR
jgi:putative spermidine/putrescine transport system permease protein